MDHSDTVSIFGVPCRQIFFCFCFLTLRRYTDETKIVEFVVFLFDINLFLRVSTKLLLKLNFLCENTILYLQLPKRRRLRGSNIPAVRTAIMPDKKISIEQLSSFKDLLASIDNIEVTT